MAQIPSDDTLITVTGDAAQQHVDKFYRSMNRERDSIPSYYAPQQALPDGSQIPTIIFNGNVSKDAEAYRDLVKNFGGISHDIQSFDCQVINPDYHADGSGSDHSSSQGRNATLAVLHTQKIGGTNRRESGSFKASVFVLSPDQDYFPSNHQTLIWKVPKMLSNQGITSDRSLPDFNFASPQAPRDMLAPRI